MSVEYDAKALTKSGMGIKEDRRLEKKKKAWNVSFSDQEITLI